MTTSRPRRALAVRGTAAIASAGLAVLLAACSSSPAVPRATSSGSATVGIATSPDSLDPNVASSADDALVMRQIFDSLVVETKQHTFKPWLAKSWTISSDGKTYTFQLKQGVKFQDGTTFDAAAVKSNIDRILAPATKSQYAASLLGTVTSATVSSTYTVVLHLSARYNPLLEGLSQAFLGMESPAAVAKYGASVGQHPVGTGAYSFVSATTNQSVVLKANTKYTSAPTDATQTGTAKLASLTFKIVPDASARVGGLTSGQLNAVESIPAEQLSSLKSNSSLKVSVSDVPGATYSYYLNLTKSPWNSQEARVALRQGMDISAVLKTLYFGQYPRAWSVLSPATDGYDSSLEGSWKFDAAASTAGFEALGYTKGSDGYLQKGGKDLTLAMVNVSPDNEKQLEIDTIVQQQLKTVGVKMVNSHPEFTQYAAATQGNAYDMESFAITTGSPSVLNSIFNSANQPNAKQFLYNVAHLDLQQMDDWGAQAAEASTTSAANGIYTQMQQYVNEQAIAIPIYVRTNSFAVRSSFSGVTFDALGYPTFYGSSVTS